MAIDRVKFYQELRNKKLFKTLTQLQVDSIDAILNECELQGWMILGRWRIYWQLPITNVIILRSPKQG